MKRESLQCVNGKAEGAGGADLPVVITRQGYTLSLLLDKVHRREMKGVERSYRLGKRLQSTRQDRQGELDKRDPSQQSSDYIAMGAGELKSMDACPNLVLDQPAGNQRLLPERFRRNAVFSENLRERYRCVEVDQRSLRSSSSSPLSLRKGITGLRGGTPLAGSAGGVIQPWRTASANIASVTSGLRLGSGGPISATTRSRSVTRIVSPRSARRTYSLSLFFRALMPMALMLNRVAFSSYFCQGED